MASSFFPEKLAGSAAFSSEVWDDMEGDAGGTEPAVGAEITVGTGSGETLDAGDKD